MGKIIDTTRLLSPPTEKDQSMIRPNRLQSFCNATIPQLRKLGTFVPCEKDGSGYTFIDRGSNVLAVAHIDTVRPETNFRVSGNFIYSPRLDDRLGVYTLVEYLFSIGIKLDVLLCENEESMGSTASFFETSKKYNWICEFDRGGHDTVLYQYQDHNMVKELEAYGFEIGHGSYSDIVDLDHLGIVGINFSTGYYKYHTKDAYMDTRVWQTSIDNFIGFYFANKDKRFEYDNTQPNYYNYKKSGSLWYKNDDYYYGSWGNSTLTVYCPTCDAKCKEAADIRLIDYFGCCSKCLIDFDRDSRKPYSHLPKLDENNEDDDFDNNVPIS